MTKQSCSNWAELQCHIRDTYPSMSKRLQQVAQFVLNNPKTIAFETIAVVADDIGVPPSTLIRFSASLGYKGFNDLKMVIKGDVLASTLNYGSRIELLDEEQHWQGDNLLSQLVDANRTALAELENSITPDEIKRATALMAAADNIFVLGSGRAYPVATYCYYALNHANARAFLLNGGGGMQQEEINNIQVSDLLIVISYSPYASATSSLAQAVAERGVPILALTDSVSSPLSNFSQVTLQVQDGQVEGFRSLSASMLLAQVLALSLADKKRTE